MYTGPHQPLEAWNNRPSFSYQTIGAQKNISFDSSDVGFTTHVQDTPRNRRDLKSAIVRGVPKNVSVLAIRRILNECLRGPGVPLAEAPIGRIEKRDNGATGRFVRIEFERHRYLAKIFPVLRSSLAEYGWRVTRGIPFTLRVAERTARTLRKSGTPVPRSVFPIGNPYSVGEAVEDEGSPPPTPDAVAEPLGANRVAANADAKPSSSRLGRSSRRALQGKYQGKALNAIRLGSLNINGCNSTKPQDLGRRCERLNLDIIAIVETHLQNDNQLKVPGYTWFGKNAESRASKFGHASGGVGILVKSHLAPLGTVVKGKEKDQLWLKIACPGRETLYIGSVYLPTGVEADVRERAFFDTEIKMTALARTGTVVAMGDWNARVSGLTTESGAELRVGAQEDKGSNESGKLLLSLLEDTDSYSAFACTDLKVSPATYERREKNGSIVKCTNLDYIVLGPGLKDRVTTYGVDNGDYQVQSDHRLIWTELSDLELHVRREPQRTHSAWKVEKLENAGTIMEYHDAMELRMQQVQESKVLEGSDIEAACAAVLAAFNDVNERLLKRKTIAKGKSAPWYTDEIKEASKRRTKKWQTYTRRNDEASWKDFSDQRALVNKMVKKAKKESWKAFVGELEIDRAQRPKWFWTKAKSLLKRAGERPSNPIKNDRGKLVSKPAEVLEAFAEHYERLGKPTEEARFDEDWYAEVDNFVANQTPIMENSPCPNLDKPFSPDEVREAIKLMRTAGAAGPDQIRPLMLQVALGLKFKGKEGSEAQEEKMPTAAVVLAELANMSFKLGEMPEIWQRGQIFNIFKKGDTTDRGNYRGITLLSVIGKTVTRMIADRLQLEAEQRNWLADEQGGFRPGRRTEDQALVLLRSLENRRLRGYGTFVFFHDMKKAYDTIWAEGLLYKLYKKGVSGRLFALLKNLYANTKSSVIGSEGGESRVFSISQGVRQGDPLSCILFNLFINDLVDEICESDAEKPVTVNKSIARALLFADDLAIPAGNLDDMRRALKAIEKHSIKWRWFSNESKSKVMYVPGRGNSTQAKSPLKLPNLELNGVTLGWVNSYEYLGLKFTRDLSWGDHILGMIKKATVRANLWKPLFMLRHLSRKSRLIFYTAMIRPLLEYASSVWTPNTKQADALEAVQLMCLRWIIPCQLSTPAHAIRAELGILSLEARRMKLEMSYYFDIRHFYDPNLLAFKAGTWKTKCTTAGKLPKGHNRILAENTIDELELQNHPSIVAFRSRPRTVARAYSSLPELKNRSQHNDFRAEVEEKVFEYEKKGWLKALSSSRFDLLRSELAEISEPQRWFHTGEYGALIKFRLRTDTLGLGKTFENGTLKFTPCPMCGDKETTVHFLAECPSLKDRRDELREQHPALIEEGAELAGKLLSCNHALAMHSRAREEWITRVHKYLIDCWKQRGEALELVKEPEPPAPQRPPPLEGLATLDS